MSASLTAQAEELLTAYAPQPDTCIAPTDADEQGEIETILSLRRKGLTQVAIAEQVGCSQSKVSRILAQYVDRREMAKLLANNLAPNMVLSLAKACKAAETLGKHGPQQTMLRVAKLLDADDSSGPRVVVQIGADLAAVQVQVSPSEGRG